MLMNLHKRNWTEGLKLRNFDVHKEANEKAIKVDLALLPCIGFLTQLFPFIVYANIV